MALSLATLATIFAFFGGWLVAKAVRMFRTKQWNTVLQTLTTKLHETEARIQNAALSPFERDRALKELGRSRSELVELKTVVDNGQFSQSANLANVVVGRANRIGALLPTTSDDREETANQR